MAQHNLSQEDRVFDPRTLSIPLLVVVPVVSALVATAVWAVRTLDRTSNDIAAVRAALPAMWTLAEQREWAHQLKAGLPGMPVPNPDDIRSKLQPK